MISLKLIGVMPLNCNLDLPKIVANKLHLNQSAMVEMVKKERDP